MKTSEKVLLGLVLLAFATIAGCTLHLFVTIIMNIFGDLTV